MQGKIKCTNCNNMIPIGAPYCIFCGVEQKVQPNIPEQGKRRKRKANGVPIVRTGADLMVPVTVEDNVDNAKKVAETDNNTLLQEESIKHDCPEAAVIEQVKDSFEAESEKVTYDSEDAGDMESSISSVNEDDPKKTAVVEDISEDVVNEEQSEPAEDAEAEFKPDDKADLGKKKGKTGKIAISSHWKEKKKEKESEYQRLHDTLTDLNNKEAYDSYVRAYDMEDVCIIVCNVNSLSKVNEMYGMDSGDLLLVSVAQAMKNVFGNNCYRIGEDEFCVVLKLINKNVVESRIESFRYELQKKEKELREAGKQLDLKIAIGYSHGTSEQSAAEVYECAKMQMKDDKSRMKKIYDPNYDGYYNDVKAEYEEIKVEIDRENVHKAVMLIFAAAVFMIFYYLFIV